MIEKARSFAYDDIGNELQVLSINNTIQECRLEWSLHLDRMEDRRLPEVAYRFFGTRNVGRPIARLRNILRKRKMNKPTP